jgi:hypothetical protein
MTQPSSIAKEFSSSRGDRLIRVMVTNPNSNVFHPSTFPDSEIQSVDGLGENISALMLRSGAVIPVALTYEQLEQKLYAPNFRIDDGSVLDLRDVTGLAALGDDGKRRPASETPPGISEPANTNQEPLATPATVVDAGHRMEDGTIYAGISPDTGKPVYTAPTDASRRMTFNEAADYAKKLNGNKYLGHDDWRVPTQVELNVLFNNRAAIGAFDQSGSYPSGCYWSSTPAHQGAWNVRFSEGQQGNFRQADYSSVRLVRSGP